MKRLLPILSVLFLISFNAHSQTPGNALNFDGADDYIDCQLPAFFSSISSNDFTLEVWATPIIGAFQRLFFAQLDANNLVSISLNPTGELVFYLNQNGLNQSVQSVNVLNSTEPSHIAVTWSMTTSEAKIFVNGEEVVYQPGVFVSSVATNGKMTIGARTDGAQLFTGEIDEVAIWSVAKPACEIGFEMDDKKTGTEPNLVAYYSFDQGIADGSNPGIDELDDATSASNDGTLMGFALTGTSSNWVISNADVYQFWGDPSGVNIGQLGLVSTTYADQYQWIYCSDLSPVPGATNLTFDPPTEDPNYTGLSDFYAVISTFGNCVDTSSCFNANGTSALDEGDLEALLSIYPNPSNGLIFIQSSLEIDRIDVHNLAGQLIQTVQPIFESNLQVELAKENGIYLVLIHTNSGLITKIIIVQNN